MGNCLAFSHAPTAAPNTRDEMISILMRQNMELVPATRGGAGADGAPVPAASGEEHGLEGQVLVAQERSHSRHVTHLPDMFKKIPRK